MLLKMFTSYHGLGLLTSYQLIKHIRADDILKTVQHSGMGPGLRGDLGHRESGRISRDGGRLNDDPTLELLIRTCDTNFGKFQIV